MHWDFVEMFDRFWAGIYICIKMPASRRTIHWPLKLFHHQDRKNVFLSFPPSFSSTSNVNCFVASMFLFITKRTKKRWSVTCTNRNESEREGYRWHTCFVRFVNDLLSPSFFSLLFSRSPRCGMRMKWNYSINDILLPQSLLIVCAIRFNRIERMEKHQPDHQSKSSRVKQSSIDENLFDERSLLFLQFVRIF